MIAVVFPGQGSQTPGMGAEEFARYPALTREADEILGYSIAKLCLENPDGRLGNTKYTQVALYVVNALQYLRWYQDGNEGRFFAGHSLGEYNALFAAGALDFGTGLRLVKRRGELMAAAGGGGMRAVLGVDADTVREVLAEAGADQVDLANLNTHKQVVLAGPEPGLDVAEAALKAASARCVKLNVSGPFHSRYMAPAADAFAAEVRAVRFGELTSTVVSNAYALPYAQDRIADTLVAQITSSVRWTETVEYLMDQGVEEFVQIGPGRVVSDMVRQIGRQAVKAAA
ncbi:ACP S-malonyltransferase [Amycolatopsis anabasis]|uniref:ACP S-malonyltransferase n=1 Tax=Amycolatopsis anabasis TaxID=1840409 RepID=UPI00131A81AE|nr:ACP S-malonyltransferase [Amycolatopsis anabasis]